MAEVICQLVFFWSNYMFLLFFWKTAISLTLKIHFITYTAGRTVCRPGNRRPPGPTFRMRSTRADGTASLPSGIIRFGILRDSVKFLWYVTGRTMFFSFPFARFLIKKEESTIRLLLSEGWPIPCNGGAGITWRFRSSIQTTAKGCGLCTFKCLKFNRF